MRKKTVPAAAFLFLMAFTTNAHAYLDPGTGSIILQALLGGAAVALATGSLYIQKVKSFFGTRKKSDERDAGR